MASRSDLFAGPNVQRLTVASWAEVASASNDIATVDVAGVEDRHHHITGVSASFIGATARTAPATLVITLGYLGTELTYSVIQGRDLVFDPPLRLPVGEALEITLSAGGSGQTGHIVCAGFTL